MADSQTTPTGLTLHDLVCIFDDAEKQATASDNLHGNPSKWGVTRGVRAVALAVIKAMEAGGVSNIR